MDVLKYIGLILLYLLVYSILNTPYNYYSWALGENSSFANNLWFLVAIVKLVITYAFLKKLKVSMLEIMIVLFTASTARIALSLPFTVVVIGYVMYFTDWLSIPFQELKTKQQTLSTNKKS